MKLGVLGSGEVGRRLAQGFAAKGHEVVLGTGSPDKPELVGLGVPTGSFEDAAFHADIAILAANGEAAPELVASLEGQLAGKVLLDVTNPFSHDETGPYLWTRGTSLGELIQRAAPSVRVVKAFNTVGNPLMIDPPGGPYRMLIAGDDTSAKSDASAFIEAAGWTPVDIGSIRESIGLEGMALAWVAYGRASGDWNGVGTIV
ncbi:MAG: putative dinucleotide-binding enzyme [Frankiales bacterium]|nr:putative dinucleotide-binding enzyme [Frankiales bacterium]